MTATDPVLASGASARDLFFAGRAGTTAEQRDEIVELLVLAEHGDPAAERRLRVLVADDPDVQGICASIARDIAALRAG